MNALRIALLGSCALAGCKLGDGGPTYSDSRDVLRWSVTDSSGAVLTQGCAISGLKSQAELVKFSAAPGSVVTEQYELESVDSERSESPPPLTDEFWCTSKSARREPFEHVPYGCYRTVDPDPPAEIQSIELLDPIAQDGAPALARGYRLTLVIKHPGVLRLELDPACAGGTFPAFDELTVLP